MMTPGDLPLLARPPLWSCSCRSLLELLPAAGGLFSNFRRRYIEGPNVIATGHAPAVSRDDLTSVIACIFAYIPILYIPHLIQMLKHYHFNITRKVHQHLFSRLKVLVGFSWYNVNATMQRLKECISSEM